MSNITMPKKGEYRPWMMWLMGMAIVALFTLLITQDAVHRAELRVLQDYANSVQETRNKEQAGFRAELANLYDRIQNLQDNIKK